MRAAVLAGVGALVVALVIVAVALSPRPVANVLPSSAATSTAPTATPTPSLSAPASAAATALARPAELASLLRPLVTTWSPAAPFLLIERSELPGISLVAVPLAGGAATPLVSLPSPLGLGYDLRDDGSALVVALPTAANTGRIAIWDLAAGTTRWLTDEEPGVSNATPIWSEDGSLIYYAAQTYVAQTNRLADLGIFRVRRDGTGKTRLRAPEENGAQLRGLTPDGRGLVWARIRAGGSVEVLDLVSGQNHSFDETQSASVLSWRASRPRALVMVGGCCAGRPGGSLALWDDVAGSSKVLMGIQSAPSVAVTSAAWEPRGARFAAAVVESLSPAYFGSVSVYDAEGRRLAAIAGTDGAQQVLWLPMGIVFTRAMDTGGVEIVLTPVSGGSALRLYQGTGFFIRSVGAP
jgi:hypothetical protein